MNIFVYILGGLFALGLLISTMILDLHARFISPQEPEYPQVVMDRTIIKYMIGLGGCIISLIVGLVIRII